MAEEATIAPSHAPAQTQTQTETTVTSLEKVYQDFKIEDAAATFQPQPQTPAPQAPQQTFKAPDPFDPNFGQWQGAVSQTVTSLNQAVAQTVSKVTQMERDLIQRKVEADIKQAVGRIAESAEIDPDLAEVHLEVTARKDPKFKAIWDNRDKNPKAFEAALKAVSELAKDKYKVRQDPQLAENQRAMKVSQQQMATTTKQTENDKWASMSASERQREFQRLLRDGGR